MTPRIWSYGEPESEEDLPIRDRPYEHFGEQGFAMADHAALRTARGAERVDLGEPFVGDGTNRGPKNWMRSDERITDDVCERLADDPWVDASDIEVIVHHGEITLSGIVDDRQQRHRAAQLAESVRGVIDVVNRIRVAPREVVREPARR